MPGRWSRWTTCAMLVLPAFACGDAPDVSTSVAEPERVLEQRVDPERTLVLTEDLRLGGDEASALYAVIAVELDEAGSIYVLERGNSRISVFGEDGTPLRTIGREGEGPGEFLGVSSMTLRRDTIVVGGARNRLHVFLTDGTHVLTRMHGALGTTGDGWHTGPSVTGTPAGWLVPAVAYFRRDAEGSDATLAPLLRMQLYHMDDSGALTESGFYWSHTSTGEWDGIFWVQPPYAVRPVWGIDGLGRVLVADTEDYVIDVYQADGTPVRRIRNDVQRRAITRALLSEYEASLCASGPECSSDRNRRRMAMTGPDYLQEVEALKGYASGHFAVRRAYSDPDPTDRIVAGDWDLFGPDGGFLGRLPISGTPHWFDGETLVVTVRDELDEQYVVRYRVEPAGG